MPAMGHSSPRRHKITSGAVNPEPPFRTGRGFRQVTASIRW